MIPIKLSIKNFMCYSNAEIDFSKFNSALIIGKINNNLDISNGSGKTTIFNAIEYALFNECGDLKLEKIVRDGQPSCSVEFEFEYDKSKFKILRQRTAKGTSSVQFFNLINSASGQEWKDISGRRNADTEDQIKKIIKVNSKSFRNTTHFVQRDFTGLTVLTPTKRKEVLKEIFDLSIYSKLEKITSSKISNLNKDNIKLDTLINSIGDQKLIINEEKIKIDSINNIKRLNCSNSDTISSELKLLINNKNILSNDILIKNNTYPLLLNKKKTLFNEMNKIDEEVLSLNNSLQSFNEKLIFYNNKLKSINIDESNYSQKLDSIKLSIELIQKNIHETSTKIRIAQNESLKLKKAISMQTCESCLQNVSSDHCEKIKNDLQVLEKHILDLSSDLQKLELEKKKELEEENKLKKLENQKTLDTKEYYIIYNNITTTSTNITNIENNINKYNITKSNIEKEYYTLISEIEKIDINELNELNIKINNINNQINILNNRLNELNILDTKYSNELSICEFKIKNCEDKIKELEELNKKKDSLTKELEIYPHILEAFSSKGIPTLIINNLLNEVQEIANNFCNKIKPGLQLQFVLQKEKSSGDEVETLDIKYFLNGQDRDFNQLSGAMKFNATFSLKLALSIITQKIIGSEIKFFLFDEIDSPLDKFSSNEFIKVIKDLQEEYKILLITHGDSLKDKFNNKLLVSQDINGASTIIQD